MKQQTLKKPISLRVLVKVNIKQPKTCMLS